MRLRICQGRCFMVLSETAASRFAKPCYQASGVRTISKTRPAPPFAGDGVMTPATAFCAIMMNGFVIGDMHFGMRVGVERGDSAFLLFDTAIPDRSIRVFLIERSYFVRSGSIAVKRKLYAACSVYYATGHQL
jgi:hypothetical protein